MTAHNRNPEDPSVQIGNVACISVACRYNPCHLTDTTSTEFNGSVGISRHLNLGAITHELFVSVAKIGSFANALNRDTFRSTYRIDADSVR